MRMIFNYRKAMRQPKQIRHLYNDVSLPFAIELVPAINFILFAVLTFFVGYGIRRMGFPHAFSHTWFFFLVGIPLGLTFLIIKIKPDGKNIYLYLYDLSKYLCTVKWRQRTFCQDEPTDLLQEKKITFRTLVKVVEERHATKNADEGNQREFTVNEEGRRVRVLSYQKPVDTDAE
ncbi:conjugal transfer protein [Listeria booriae]|uniref:Conjugal transfer protein n=1 Tax=Listeria booriae TaxID=1552123 RepID=A0A841Y2I6_9LIST|nr:conjugal transfer protein [Listeria booriae]MBC1317747.1 conjugal transfer protein [Listeria booriae]